MEFAFVLPQQAEGHLHARGALHRGQRANLPAVIGLDDEWHCGS